MSMNHGMRILLMVSLVVLGVCLAIFQPGGDDVSAVSSHMDGTFSDECGFPASIRDCNQVCPDLVTKTSSYDAKEVTFNVDGIVYKISDKDAVTVTGFSGYPALELVIPSRIASPDGSEYMVVKIAKDAFKGMAPVESAVIPDTVVEVGKNAFMGCVALKSLTVPVSVKCPHGSKDHAFKNVFLTRLVLTKGDDGLQRKDNDFWKSWKESLEELVVDEGIGSITTSLKDWKYLKSVTLKDVESIREDQFRRCDSLVTVVAPKVQTVHDNAFMDCPRLNKVDIPSFESYTKGIFVHCPNLKTVVSEKLFIDSGQLFLVLDDGNLSLIQQLDADAEMIMIPDKVTPPSGGDCVVTEIGKEAFREHKNLKTIFIHDDVTKVDEHAFHDCKSLKAITIPIGVDCSYDTKKTAFEGVRPEAVELTKGGYDSDHYMDNGFWKPWKNSLISLALEEGITDFKTSFKGSKLISVYMRDVKTIRENQFKDCRNLTMALFKEAGTIEKSALENCEMLVTVEVSNATDIGNKAFSGCEMLFEFMGDSVERIGEMAFYGCGTLESFNLDNTKEIGSKAFWNTNVSPAKTTSKNDANKAFGKDAGYGIKAFFKEWWYVVFTGVSWLGTVISSIVAYFAHGATAAAVEIGAEIASTTIPQITIMDRVGLQIAESISAEIATTSIAPELAIDLNATAILSEISSTSTEVAAVTTGTYSLGVAGWVAVIFIAIWIITSVIYCLMQ